MMQQLRKLGEFTTTALALGVNTRDKLAIFWRFTKNIRVQAGLGSYHPEEKYRLRTRYGTVTMRDNFGDVTNLPDLFVRGVYRVTHIADDGAILDVGANIGLFAAWAAHHNPAKQLHCYEPLSGNATLIPLNAPSAVVHRVGVGRERSSVTLSVDKHAAMASALPREVATHEERFDVITLDQLTREAGIDQVAFLKIDTEGMELDVLDGATHTLSRTRRIAMETHGPELHSGSVDRLRAAGFELEDAPLKGETRVLFATRR